MRSTTRTGAIALTTVTALLAVVGCGVPLDDSPRAINRATSTTQPAATTSPTGAVSSVVLYFVDEDGALRPYEQDVRYEPTVQDAVSTLLASQVSEPLTTRIPPGTGLTDDLEVDGDLVRIDLTSEIDEITGDAQKLAFAQIVFTVLEFPQYERVAFSVEGEPVNAPTDGENLAVVTADDYDAPINPD